MEGTSEDHLLQPCYSMQGQLEKVTWCTVQSRFEYFQAWRLHNLSGQSISVFHISLTLKHTAHLTAKEGFFPRYVNCNSQSHKFCQLPLVLSLGTTEKSLSRSSLLPWPGIIMWVRSPEPFRLQAEQFQLSQAPLTCQMLQSV